MTVKTCGNLLGKPEVLYRVWIELVCVSRDGKWCRLNPTLCGFGIHMHFFHYHPFSTRYWALVRDYALENPGGRRPEAPDGLKRELALVPNMGIGTRFLWGYFQVFCLLYEERSREDFFRRYISSIFLFQFRLAYVTWDQW